ncbi:MAG: DUF4468 domain-containing protein [Bacteroidaceae bacterium]|nr:DUF4468 domain-containing protein [Bacteroidaceae bacterium]
MKHFIFLLFLLLFAPIDIDAQITFKYLKFKFEKDHYSVKTRYTPSGINAYKELRILYLAINEDGVLIENGYKDGLFVKDSKDYQYINKMTIYGTCNPKRLYESELLSPFVSNISTLKFLPIGIIAIRANEPELDWINCEGENLKKVFPSIGNIKISDDKGTKTFSQIHSEYEIEKEIDIQNKCEEYVNIFNTKYKDYCSFTDNGIEFSKVIKDVNESNKTELYNKCLELLNSTFNNSKAAIQNQDRESGLILGKFPVRIILGEYLAKFMEYDEIFKIEVRDSRIKLSVTIPYSVEYVFYYDKKQEKLPGPLVRIEKRDEYDKNTLKYYKRTSIAHQEAFSLINYFEMKLSMGKEKSQDDW